MVDLAKKAKIKSKSALNISVPTTESSEDNKTVDLPTFDDDKVLYEVSYDNDFDFSETLRAIASYNRRH